MTYAPLIARAILGDESALDEMSAIHPPSRDVLVRTRARIGALPSAIVEATAGVTNPAERHRLMQIECERATIELALQPEGPQ